MEPVLPLEISPQTRLVPVSLERTAEFMALIERNRSYLRDWMSWLDATRTEADLTSKFLEQAIGDLAERRSFAFWIEQERKIAGVIHLREIDLSHRKAVTGYWVGQEYRGRGLAKLATRAVCRYAFGELRLNRIEIRCATGNTASQAIPLALGFRHEGVLRENEWLYDHFVDHQTYALLARDWPDRNEP